MGFGGPHMLPPPQGISMIFFMFQDVLYMSFLSTIFRGRFYSATAATPLVTCRGFTVGTNKFRGVVLLC
jgi:hypothetical protein